MRYPVLMDCPMVMILARFRVDREKCLPHGYNELLDVKVPILRLVIMVWTIRVLLVWNVARFWWARIANTVVKFFLRTILSWF